MKFTKDEILKAAQICNISIFDVEHFLVTLEEVAITNAKNEPDKENKNFELKYSNDVSSIKLKLSGKKLNDINFLVLREELKSAITEMISISMRCRNL